jgi:hypothetical protein
MPKFRPRYKRGSHQIGELVEFIGRDYHNRGLGIVVGESNINECYIRVFWQISRVYEQVHKAKIKRVLDIEYVK